MASNNVIDIRIIAKDLASQVISGINATIGKFTSKAILGFQQLGTVVTTSMAAAAAGVAAFAKTSIDAFTDQQKALTSLEIIAGRFNVSQKLAREEAIKLGKELRIGVGASAESLQNLLQSGLNLPQATDLLRRFTNEAMTGKSANISLSQAVSNLAFAYKTGNSALGNMSGVSENFNDIIERGARLMKIKTSEMNEAQLAEAKYRGMIDLTNLTMGSSEKFQGQFIDNMAVLEAQINEAQVAIGAKLVPKLNELLMIFLNSGAVKTFTDIFGSFVDKAIELAEVIGPKILEVIKENLPAIQTFATIFAGLAVAITAIGAAIAIINSPLAIAVGLLATFSGFATTIMEKYGITFETIKTKAIEVGTEIKTRLIDGFAFLQPELEEIWALAQEAFRQIKIAITDSGDAVDRFKNSLKDSGLMGGAALLNILDAFKSVLRVIKDNREGIKQIIAAVLDFAGFGIKVVSAMVLAFSSLIRIVASVGEWLDKTKNTLMKISNIISTISPSGLLAKGITGLLGGGKNGGIVAPKFATGGVVPGLRTTGDQVMARVNSGEMVLNKGQQAALFDMINKGKGGGGNTFNVYVTAGMGGDMQETARVLVREVQRLAKQEGIDLGNLNMIAQ